MTFAGFFGFIALLLVGAEPDPASAPSVRVMTVQRQLIVSVPVRPHPIVQFRWEEDKGPKCVPVGAIAWALLAGEDSIDLVLRNRQRIRAKLDGDCAGLDFYGGLYIHTGDGQVCAKRDSIRSRVGGTCRIEKFRMLVPKVER